MGWFIPMLIGAGIGAGAGQLFGGNTESTLTGMGLGAATGGLGGYMGLWGGGAGAVSNPLATYAANPTIGNAALINQAWLGGTGVGGAAEMLGAGGTAATGSGGLFGGGLGSLLGLGMMGAGLGMSLAQAYSPGKAVGAYAPTERMSLTPEGAKLEKELHEATRAEYEDIKQGILPQNLIAPYIGQIKTSAGQQRRISSGLLSGLAAGRVGSGRSVSAATETAISGMEAEQQPAEYMAGMRRERYENILGELQNIANLDLQVPLLRAGSKYTQYGYPQMKGVEQGQALGQAAQLAALLLAGRMRA